MTCHNNSNVEIFSREMETRSRSLLEKYDIPLSHLDFDYIKTCGNAKELERILNILRSGEEGYFPDLTKFAEDKLKEVKPDSKILRTEEILPTKSQLGAVEWEEANGSYLEWTDEVKFKDKFLATIAESSGDKEIPIPPIRKQTKSFNFGVKENTKPNDNIKSAPNSKPAIKSTDYRKWDKYDPDTEILKMDLDEERNREQVERMNRINLEKNRNLISEIQPEAKDVLDKLTNVEKESLATRYKDKGNDYFKAKEYENAIQEYTNCINTLPSAAGYNNRAVAYLKLNQYANCIEDCNRCLQIEHKNIKALLRKAQAFLGFKNNKEAYDIFLQVISIEPSNVIARNNLNELKNHLQNPPQNATRIKIEEESTRTEENLSEEIANQDVSKTKENPNHQKSVAFKSDEKQEKISKSNTPKMKVKKQIPQHKEDLSKLIIPNKIIRSKLASAMQGLEELQKQKKTFPKKQTEVKECKKPEEPILKLSKKNLDHGNKNLIQEI